MLEKKEAQRRMHKDFFDRCQDALLSGFYMEAILMEYAAIESRLEIILSVLGCPCHSRLPDNKRKDVMISHRIECFKKCLDNADVFENSKLTAKYFKALENWITERNRYIHGLYKNEVQYEPRIKGAKKMAEDGLGYCKTLYNETNRLKYIKKKHPEAFVGKFNCSSKKCKMFKEVM